jgi:glyoxylase-like metal-dependent hydrolase (beta-lactamase superfamily II)
MQVITVPILPFKMLQSHIIRDKKTIIVDTGNPGSVPKILAAMKKHHIAKEDVSLIIITHSHLDHSGSAAELQRILKVPIAMHQLEVTYVENGTRLPLTPKDSFGKIFKNSALIKKDVEKLKVDIVLNGGEDLNPYGVDARVVFTPGHTIGSVSVLLANGEMIAGDVVSGGILLGGMFNSDVPTWPIFHDNTPTSIESLKQIIDLSPAKVHVGHGGPLDVRSLQKFIVSQ